MITSSYSGKIGTPLSKEEVRSLHAKLTLQKYTSLKFHYVNYLPALHIHKFKSVLINPNSIGNDNYVIELVTEGYYDNSAIFERVCVEDEIDLNDIKITTNFHLNDIYLLPYSEAKLYIYNLYPLIKDRYFIERVVKRKLKDMFYMFDEDGVILPDGSIVHLK